MQVTVPLVAYHEDRRVVIGEATVDTNILEKKVKASGHEGQVLTQIVATVFTFNREE